MSETITRYKVGPGGSALADVDLDGRIYVHRRIGGGAAHAFGPACWCEPLETSADELDRPGKPFHERINAAERMS